MGASLSMCVGVGGASFKMGSKRNQLPMHHPDGALGESTCTRAAGEPWWRKNTREIMMYQNSLWFLCAKTRPIADCDMYHVNIKYWSEAKEKRCQNISLKHSWWIWSPYKGHIYIPKLNWLWTIKTADWNRRHYVRMQKDNFCNKNKNHCSNFHCKQMMLKMLQERFLLFTEREMFKMDPAKEEVLKIMLLTAAGYWSVLKKFRRSVCAL